MELTVKFLVASNILPHWTDQVVPKGKEHIPYLHELPPTEQQTEGLLVAIKMLGRTET